MPDTKYYARTKERFEKAGIRIYGFGNRDVHNQDAIVLGLERRDAKIEEYVNQPTGAGQGRHSLYDLRSHGQRHLEHRTRVDSRRRVGARLRSGGGGGRALGGNIYYLPLTHGRVYSQDEIWENFRYFVEKAAPVAEEAGVRIGIHPDDPPEPELGGVPRCIFSSYDGYERAMHIADSPNVGICFCIGCWLEGGELMGRGVEESLKEYGRRNKLFKIHFRNVDRSLPHFVETFVDDGYFDMYKAMRVLEESGFDGVLIPDHIPLMANDPRIGTAYTIGYMKALLQRAQEEVQR